MDEKLGFKGSFKIKIMARQKELYMEVAKVSMQRQLYDSLPTKLKEEMELTSVTVDDYPYQDDVYWQELNRISAKAYKKKKAHEYDLRNGIVKPKKEKT